MKKTLYLIAILIFSISLKAQENANRVLPKNDHSTMEQYSSLLDSMMEHWYFKKQQSFQKDKPVVEANKINNRIDKATEEQIAERLNSINSVFPLTYNGEVANWIKMYVNKNARSQYLIGMSDYYFPIIEEILDQYDLPIELKYIPIIESALNPEAKSYAGAVGLWQFLYSTGRMYGLEINSYIDQRKDPVKSTHAAALFLKDLYSLYGDWNLVLAAYNCGPGNVNRAIRRTGKSDFWEIYKRLPRETRGYIPAYIAATYLMEYYDEHGITPEKPKINLITDTVGISKRVHFKQISEVIKIPYEELKELNPQYRRDILPGDKTYYLRLPLKYIATFIDKEQEIYSHKDSLAVAKGIDVAAVPAYRYSSKTRSNYYEPVSKKDRTKLGYTIKSGDTYGFIAGLYNVRVRDLRSWNSIPSNRLRVGQNINVWVPKNKVERYKKINTMSDGQRKKLMASTFKRKSTTSSHHKASKPRDSRYVWYRIRKGDNLWVIAKRYPGISPSQIQYLNGFTRRDLKTLRVGQYIKIKLK